MSDLPYLHLKPTGRICLGEHLAEFQTATAAAADTPHPRIVLDLAEVSYIDSSGLGDILKLYLECRNKGKKLVLVHVPAPILKILRSARLTGVFTISENLETASRA